MVDTRAATIRHRMMRKKSSRVHPYPGSTRLPGSRRINLRRLSEKGLRSAAASLRKTRAVGCWVGFGHGCHLAGVANQDSSAAAVRDLSSECPLPPAAEPRVRQVPNPPVAAGSWEEFARVCRLAEGAMSWKMSRHLRARVLLPGRADCLEHRRVDRGPVGLKAPVVSREDSAQVDLLDRVRPVPVVCPVRAAPVVLHDQAEYPAANPARPAVPADCPAVAVSQVVPAVRLGPADCRVAVAPAALHGRVDYPAASQARVGCQAVHQIGPEDCPAVVVNQVAPAVRLGPVVCRAVVAPAALHVRADCPAASRARRADPGDCPVVGGSRVAPAAHPGPVVCRAAVAPGELHVRADCPAVSPDHRRVRVDYPAVSPDRLLDPAADRQVAARVLARCRAQSADRPRAAERPLRAA